MSFNFRYPQLVRKHLYAPRVDEGIITGEVHAGIFFSEALRWLQIVAGVEDMPVQVRFNTVVETVPVPSKTELSALLRKAKDQADDDACNAHDRWFLAVARRQEIALLDRSWRRENPGTLGRRR